MKSQFIFTFLIILFSQTLFGQCAGLKKYELGNSGCSAYFRSKPDTVDVALMPDDSSAVYTASVDCNSITYGVVLLKFRHKISADKDEQIKIAQKYGAVLKDSYFMNQCAGYGTGHVLESNPNAQGLIDDCEDTYGNRSKIKIWIDTDFVALMYLVIPFEELENNNFSLQELFLNGFRFPEK